MLDGRQPRPLVIALSAIAGLLLSMSCAGVRPTQPPGGGSGGNGGNSGGNSGGNNGAAGARPPPPDGGVTPHTAGCTTRVEGVQATGRYCGRIGDGCNGIQEGGNCPGDGI